MHKAKAVESAWRPAPKPPQAAKLARIFRKFPARFPAGSEISCRVDIAAPVRYSRNSEAQGRCLDRTGVNAHTFLARAVCRPQRLAGFNPPTAGRARQQP